MLRELGSEVCVWVFRFGLVFVVVGGVLGRE